MIGSQLQHFSSVQTRHTHQNNELLSSASYITDHIDRVASSQTLVSSNIERIVGSTSRVEQDTSKLASSQGQMSFDMDRIRELLESSRSERIAAAQEPDETEGGEVINSQSDTNALYSVSRSFVSSAAERSN